MRKMYWSEVPWILRLLGCFGIEDKSVRFRWGELCAGWGFALKYFVYHEEATLHFLFIWGRVYLKVPMLINQRPGTEDWSASYGFSTFERAIHLNWRTACKILHFPWDWQHVRHTYLWPDGRVHHHAVSRRYEPEPEEIKQSFPFTHTLKNGRVQNRTATIYGDEREWRWRWFTWCRWPRKIHRCISINFDGEVGPGEGSYKGGTIGMGYEWRHGETMEQSLRRLEADPKAFRR